MRVVKTVRAELAETEAILSQTESKFAQTKDELRQTEATLGTYELEIETLEYELEHVNSELTQKDNELSRVNNRLAQKDSAIQSLRITAEENKFFFYYIKPEQRFDVADVARIVYAYKPAKEYQLDVFDCSEMSAQLERELENEGFHTLIVVGDAPFDPSGRHAWLLVETSPGEYIPVEATGPSVIYWNNQFFNNYFVYDYVFENIQELLNASSDISWAEWNWWKFFRIGGAL